MTDLTPERYGGMVEGFHIAYAILRAHSEDHDRAAGLLIEQVRDRGNFDEAITILQCVSILTSLTLRRFVPEVREQIWQEMAATLEAIERQRPT